MAGPILAAPGPAVRARTRWFLQEGKRPCHGKDVAKVTSQLQITVPGALAAELDIRPGGDIDWTISDNALRITHSTDRQATLDRETRLRLFDQATERQGRRQRDIPFTPAGAARDRPLRPVVVRRAHAGPCRALWPAGSRGPRTSSPTACTGECGQSIGSIHRPERTARGPTCLCTIPCLGFSASRSSGDPGSSPFRAETRARIRLRAPLHASRSISPVWGRSGQAARCRSGSIDQ